MALEGTIEIEVEVKSPPEKFWNALRDSTTLFPKAFPEQYKTIEVLEGDGKAAGSVRLIKYADGSPLVSESKEKIDAVDEENKVVSYSVVGGDLQKYCKRFHGKISISAKGEGSVAKWNCDYEKVSDDHEVPHIIKDFVAKNFLEVDELLLNQA